ncbi:hypothetical protein LNQ52_15530 [Klebsiella pneumoniae subsp. pneumoniae]|nr:hypothetical protein [Klebsiella pneumoniae subsp. pneumoniae]
MTDVHQFFGLLRKYQLSRQQAFRLVSDDLACRVDRHALPSLLETVRQEGNEIMIFVGNRGCVQIFTGAPGKAGPHARLAEYLQYYFYPASARREPR